MDQLDNQRADAMFVVNMLTAICSDEALVTKDRLKARDAALRVMAALDARAESRRPTISAEALAQEIRRVDGNHSLGAGALAEALMPFIEGEDQRQVIGYGPSIDKLAELADAGYFNPHSRVMAKRRRSQNPDKDRETQE